MSDLTEIEVIDRMRTSLKEAIQASTELATFSRKGPSYHRLREHLLLVEGSCRQLAAMREDSRWYNIGMLMAQCHKKAGGWLRGWKDKEGRLHHWRIGEKNKLFELLTVNLKGVFDVVEALRTSKTGKIGMILPEMPTQHRRIGAPVNGYRVSPGGIILHS